MITCTNCGHSNPEGAITCEACYVELPKMASCPSCHAQVPEDAVFCSQCGTSLQQGAEPPSLDMATAPTQVNAGKGVPATDVVSFDTPDGIPATDVVVPLPDPPAMAPPDQIEMTEFPDMDLGFAPTEVTPPVSPSPSMAAEMSEQPTENMMQPPPSLRSPLPTPPEIPDMEEPTPSTPPESSQPSTPPASSVPPMPPEVSQPPMAPDFSTPPLPDPEVSPAVPEPMASEPPQPESPQPAATPIPKQPPAPLPVGATQLQLPVASLLHERSNTTVDLPTNLNLVHIGKPNDRIPPDIDVSGFPNSDVVSRVHADIRIDPDGYYIEDTGSANGTYINNQPLRPGDRYRLRAGDRISLGKEDKVSFIFHPG